MSRGTLYGVSVGPGDPELLTLKAVRVIREADVVAAPTTGRGSGVAYDIAREHVQDKPMLWCPVPMTRDERVLAQAHAEAADEICAHLAQGEDVAYLCLGDVALYSSFYYVAELVGERGYDVCAIPGVSSPSAASAALGRPLCMGDERLLVAPLEVEAVDELLDIPANKVLLKPKTGYAALRDGLAERGCVEDVWAVSHCAMADERVYSLVDVGEVDYLTVLFIDV